MKKEFVLGVVLALVMWAVSPVLAQAPAAPAATVAPAAEKPQDKPKVMVESPAPKPPVRPPALTDMPVQEFTLTGKIVVKSVALVDSDGRETYLPPARKGSPESEANDAKNFVGKTVTIVCKGREGMVNPRTGKKNVMIAAIESIKEGLAPADSAKPAADKPAVDKPAVDKPAVAKPAADKPVADKPVADKTAVPKK